jgi:hypothetical protein
MAVRTAVCSSFARKGALFGVIVLAVSLAAAALALAPQGTNASSHREAPYIATDPMADNTDVYAFRSPDRPATVTLIGTWIPIEEASQGPNFYFFGEDVAYYINVDNDGDAKADIRYRFDFESEFRTVNTFLYNTGRITSINDPDYNQRQFYDITRYVNGNPTVVARHLPVPPVNIGPRSTPDYADLAAQAVKTVGGDTKVFAGQRDDPFFVDTGSAFDLFGLRPFNPLHVIPLPKEDGVDGLSGFNTHAIALQVPINELTSNGKTPSGPKSANAVISVWSSSERQSTRVLLSDSDKIGAESDGVFKTSGPWVQVSRLANPLVNELVIPLRDNNRFNASKPKEDARFANYVKNPEPARLIEALYPINVPAPPRNDLVQIFLTGIPGLNQPPDVVASEQMRLNVAIPPTPFNKQDRLGLLAGQADGFPNGRRLIDDVVDIELRALAGATPLTPKFDKAPNNQLGDGVDSNDRDFLESFPYVATPHEGYDHFELHSNQLRARKS